MYKVMFEHADGRRGACIENGGPVTFTAQADAEAYAAELEAHVSDADPKIRTMGIIPMRWVVEEVKA